MEKQIKDNNRSPRRRIVNLLVHVILAVLAVIWLLPIVWIILTSFRAEPGAYTKTFLPKSYTIKSSPSAAAVSAHLLCCRYPIRSAACGSK